jgi:glycosyltransferase involved in cell wall biosynthesis
MNLCILSGSPLGVYDGVGDFSWFLAQALSPKHGVSIIAPPGGDVPGLGEAGRAPVYSIPSGWGIRACAEVRRLVERLKPDATLVQFVPHLYGWQGVKPCFALLLVALMRGGHPIVTVAHEFSRPFGLSPTAALHASAHRVLFSVILRASRKVVLTTPWCLDLFERRFPRRRADFHLIPVGSNIPVVATSEGERQARRHRLGIEDGELVVSTFGAAMEPATTRLTELAGWLVRQATPVRIVVVGKAGEALRAKWARHRAIVERTVVTGPVTGVAAAGYLSMSDLFVAFYPDGASTRRTGLMAGLAHGLPTVANVGPLTDPSLASSRALHLVGDMARESEQERLRRLCVDPELRARLGKRGRVSFEAHFAWERIAERHTSVVEEAVVP